MLQVRYVGGFMTPESTAAQLPLASVYADGRVVVPGPVAAIHPAFAWPNLQVRDVGRDGVEEFVARALDAGSRRRPTWACRRSPTHRPPGFTLVTGSGTYVREAYALFETTTPEEATGGDSGLTPDQRAAREELLDLATSLADLAAGQGGEEPPPAYEPDAVAAVVRPWTPSDDVGQGLVPEPAPWPGPALPGEPLGPLPGPTCGTATDEEERAVVDAAQAATVLTPWLAPDGSRWSVTFRPLLPHESGCADRAG